MQNFIVIAVFLSLGALSKRLLALPEKAPLYINQLIINGALPAVILLKLPQLKLDRYILLPMLAPWLLAAILLPGLIALARRLQWSRDLLGAVLLLSLYGNTSYFGFPMVHAFFGDAGMPYAITLDQLGNFVMFAIGTPVLLALFKENRTGAESGTGVENKTNAENKRGAEDQVLAENKLLAANNRPRVSILAIIKRIFSFPPFYALLAGLALNGITYPAIIEQVLSWLGMLLAPLAMFIVGLQLAWHVPSQLRQPLGVVLMARLLISPALTLLFFLLTNHRELAARVTVFEVAMPTMVTAAIMAVSTNLSPRLCTAAVGFGLIFSLLTLPIWFALVNWLLV